jgi:SAM-dependent methyltransferase
VNSALRQSSLRRVADWVDLYLDGIHDSLRNAAPYSQGRLLDVGCGVKPYQRFFVPYVRQYIGVEYGTTFSLTKDSSGTGSPDVVYDGTNLPFATASFETVLSVSVLEHTPDPERLFAEMARVLAPGGTMIQLVPFSFRLHEEPHDYYRFTPHSLRHLCGLYGLEVIRIGAHGSLWSVLCQKLMTYLVFDVSRLRAMAQSLGKLGFEAPRSERVRYWTLPITLPVIMALAISARALERTIPTRDEALGFFLVARKA